MDGRGQLRDAVSRSIGILRVILNAVVDSKGGFVAAAAIGEVPFDLGVSEKGDEQRVTEKRALVLATRSRTHRRWSPPHQPQHR